MILKNKNKKSLRRVTYLGSISIDGGVDARSDAGAGSCRLSDSLVSLVIVVAVAV